MLRGLASTRGTAAARKLLQLDQKEIKELMCAADFSRRPRRPMLHTLSRGLLRHCSCGWNPCLFYMCLRSILV